MAITFSKDRQYYKFCLYGILKNLRFFEPFLLLFILERVDGNYNLAMSLYSIRLLLRTILEIPSGVIADALGRKGSMLFAYSLYIFSFIAYYFANSYGWLLLPTILFGMGDAFRTGTHKAMIIDYLEMNNWQQSKTEYYGKTRSWSQAGSSISALLAAIITIITGNYNFIFIASTVPYFIGFILLATYPKELNGSSQGISIKEKIKTTFSTSWNTLKDLKKLSQLSGTSFFFGFHHATKDILQTVLSSLSILISLTFIIDNKIKTSVIIGVFYTVIYFISSIASGKAGYINKKIKNSARIVSTLGTAGVLTGVLIGLSMFFNLYFLSGLLFLLLFAILNIQRPSVVSYVSESYNTKIMASVLSVESQLGSLSGAIIAFLIGILSNYFQLSVALIITSLICLLPLLINQFYTTIKR